MQGWREGVVPAGKGSREPRISPNQDKQADQNGQRRLVVIQGGDPSSVTHRPPVRRGSRTRSGGFKETKAEVLAKLSADEIDDYRRDDVPVVSQDVEGSSIEGASVITLAPPSGNDSAPEKPYMWSEQDFTPEALAKYDRRVAVKKRPQAAQLQLRRQLEIAAVRFQKGRYKPPKPTAFEQHGECVSQIDLRDQDDPPTDIRRNYTLQSSHTGTDASARKK